MDFSILLYHLIWMQKAKTKHDPWKKETLFSPFTYISSLEVAKMSFLGQNFLQCQLLTQRYQPAHLSISTFLDLKTDVIPDVSSTQCSWIPQKKLQYGEVIFYFLKKQMKKTKIVVLVDADRGRNIFYMTILDKRLT